MKRPTLLLALLLGTTSPRAAVPTIAIDASSSAGKVSPLLYGLMTEEINHSYDGGLYAELVQNRAFLDDAASPVHWSPILGDGAAATMALDKEQPRRRRESVTSARATRHRRERRDSGRARHRGRRHTNG